MFSTVEEFKREIAFAVEAKPNLILIRAHGFQLGMFLAGGQTLSVEDKIPELSRLAPGTTVILNSCATGEGSGGEWNLANYFAILAPQLRIFAPIRRCGSCVKLSSNGSPVFQTETNGEDQRHGNMSRMRITHSDGIEYSPDSTIIQAKQVALISDYKKRRDDYKKWQKWSVLINGTATMAVGVVGALIGALGMNLLTNRR